MRISEGRHKNGTGRHMYRLDIHHLQQIYGPALVVHGTGPTLLGTLSTHNTTMTGKQEVTISTLRRYPPILSDLTYCITSYVPKFFEYSMAQMFPSCIDFDVYRALKLATMIPLTEQQPRASMFSPTPTILADILLHFPKSGHSSPLLTLSENEPLRDSNLRIC